MRPPTLAQQRGLAFAPMPFAIISFFSSIYVIYNILCKDRKVLQRLYHRLVLGMNFALIPLSFSSIWGTRAVPEGTPYYQGASGTISTCTAQGFMCLMFSMTVPIYYGSLSLQSFMAIKHNFNEQKYCYIEKWIHGVAWCVPFVFASITAATENFNPNLAGCWDVKAPQGCDMDPDMVCVRGDDVGYFWVLTKLAFIFLLLVFPPVVIISMFCWMRSVYKSMEGSRGMTRVKQNAKKQMMKCIAKQVCLYLFAYWSTFIFGLIHAGYRVLMKNVLYDFTIFAQSIFAFQGFMFAVVYFTLQRQGKPNIECVNPTAPPSRRELTVEDIRSNVSRKRIQMEDDGRRENYEFNIFDGVPDENSPWARFIDDDDDCSDDHGENEGT